MPGHRGVGSDRNFLEARDIAQVAGESGDFPSPPFRFKKLPRSRFCVADDERDPSHCRCGRLDVERKADCSADLPGMTPGEQSFLLRALKLDTRRCCQSCAVTTHFIYHMCRAVPSGRVQSALRAQECQCMRAVKRSQFAVSDEERRVLREREEPVEFRASRRHIWELV